MGKPNAADVPTASWIFTLHQVMNGTEIKPPPAPTSAESTPITLPAPKVPTGPGSERLGGGLRSRNICVAEKATKTENRMDSALPDRAAASCAPTSEPSRMPGANIHTTGHRTAPRFWCARTEDSEVKQIVASEVATATFTVNSAGKPLDVRMSVMKGTISIPPPMPSRPARKPVAVPSRASSKRRRGSMSICTRLSLRANDQKKGVCKCHRTVILNRGSGGQGQLDVGFI